MWSGPGKSDASLNWAGIGLYLECGRAKVPQGRVQPLSIAEDFDVLEHLPVHLLARVPRLVVAELALVRAEEAFLWGACCQGS